MGFSENTSAIQTQDLGKRFGSHWVVANINLTIQRGEAVALFGDNGSGKSTLLKILASLLDPSFGSATVLGFHCRKEKDALRKKVQLLGHEKQLYSGLTVRENMDLAANLLGLSRQSQHITATLEILQMHRFQGNLVGEISEGMKKRLALAKLLLGDNDLVLLDEPHAGLDAAGKEILHDLLGRWRRVGKTVLVASHDHNTILPHVDRTLTLQKGTLS